MYIILVSTRVRELRMFTMYGVVVLGSLLTCVLANIEHKRNHEVKLGNKDGCLLDPRGD